jgi:hypothetical protein
MLLNLATCHIEVMLHFLVSFLLNLGSWAVHFFREAISGMTHDIIYI